MNKNTVLILIAVVCIISAAVVLFLNLRGSRPAGEGGPVITIAPTTTPAPSGK